MLRRTVALVALASLAVAGCGDDDTAASVDATTDEFSTLDASGDSYLDTDEVAEWVDDTGVFRSWDEDADSELDRDEIAGNAFSLWDSDNNGTVSQQEWETATDLWYPGGANFRVFRDWDGDGDSELDADEFREEFDASTLGESWRVDAFDAETFKKAYFELYDLDDDGRVTRSEWIDGSRTFGIAG